MGLKWDKITWYSQLAAVIIFVAVFFVGFYLGTFYENAVSVSKPYAPGGAQAGATNPPGALSAPSSPQAVSSTASTLTMSYPYAVSWQGVNGSTINLASVSLGWISTSASGENRQIYALTLAMNINAGFGSFCTSAFGSYGLKRILDESGNTAPPVLLDDNCAPSRSLLAGQRAAFPVSQNDNQFTIGVFNPDGTQQTFFIVRVSGGQLQVEPAPTSG